MHFKENDTWREIVAWRPSTIKFQSLKCHCILDIPVCGILLIIKKKIIKIYKTPTSFGE